MDPSMECYDRQTLLRKERAVQRGREHGEQPTTEPAGERVPPGQVLTQKFPILDLGVRPEWDSRTSQLLITGLVQEPCVWSLDDIKGLPHVDQVSDFHCVTRWSKLDVHWRGVPLRCISDRVKTQRSARFLIQRSADGYSTSLPLEEALDEDVLLADELDGKPIPLEHGGPIRMIVPKLYGWKGAKFLRALEFTEQDEPGFWELRGYHPHGDPWREERFNDQWWV